MQKILTDIRQYYAPVQPAVKRSAEDVVYYELPPAPEIQSYIYCYWELKTSRKLNEPFSYRVVADGCIDIFFELSNPGENYVMGFCKKYTEFLLDHSFHYVGVRFLPAMFPQLFKINAAELSNRFENLATVLPGTARFIADSFNTGQDLNRIKIIFDQYFIQLISGIDLLPDNRFYEAIHIILKNYGVLNIEKELKTGISPRQLRRLFEFYIGDSAKTFCKVVRFQNILRAKPSVQSLRKNKLFFDTGYYDQAHFIKDFKNFFGVTPGKAFGR